MAEDTLLSPHPATSVPELEPTGIELPVVPDWDAQVEAATRMARLIDRHLDYEAYSRGVLEAEQLSPCRLCPEQRVDLVTDLRAVTGG
jgi:hypothetical protein